MSDLEQMQYDHVKELKARIKELEIENRCDVCLGEPIKDANTCMCNGTGKMSEAAKHLRTKLYAQNKWISRFDEKLKRAEEILQRYRNEKKE